MFVRTVFHSNYESIIEQIRLFDRTCFVQVVENEQRSVKLEECSVWNFLTNIFWEAVSYLSGGQVAAPISTKKFIKEVIKLYKNEIESKDLPLIRKALKKCESKSCNEEISKLLEEINASIKAKEQNISSLKPQEGEAPRVIAVVSETLDQLVAEQEPPQPPSSTELVPPHLELIQEPTETNIDRPELHVSLPPSPVGSSELLPSSSLTEPVPPPLEFIQEPTDIDRPESDESLPPSPTAVFEFPLVEPEPLVEPQISSPALPSQTVPNKSSWKKTLVVVGALGLGALALYYTLQSSSSLHELSTYYNNLPSSSQLITTYNNRAEDFANTVGTTAAGIFALSKSFLSSLNSLMTSPSPEEIWVSQQLPNINSELATEWKSLHTTRDELDNQIKSMNIPISNPCETTTETDLKGNLFSDYLKWFSRHSWLKRSGYNGAEGHNLNVEAYATTEKCQILLPQRNLFSHPFDYPQCSVELAVQALEDRIKSLQATQKELKEERSSVQSQIKSFSETMWDKLRNRLTKHLPHVGEWKVSRYVGWGGHRQINVNENEICIIGKDPHRIANGDSFEDILPTFSKEPNEKCVP